MTELSREAIRQKKYRDKKRNRGLSKIELYIPTPYKDKLKMLFESIIRETFSEIDVSDGCITVKDWSTEMSVIELKVPASHSERIKNMLEMMIPHPSVPENRSALHVFEIADKITKRGDRCKVWRAKDGWHVCIIR